MDSYDTLVLFLAVALAVFLVLGIIFMVYLIRISRRVHEITEKARAAADNVESAARIFRKSAGPAVFSRIVANVVESWRHSKGKKEKS